MNTQPHDFNESTPMSTDYVTAIPYGNRALSSLEIDAVVSGEISQTEDGGGQVPIRNEEDQLVHYGDFPWSLSGFHD